MTDLDALMKEAHAKAAEHAVWERRLGELSDARTRALAARAVIEEVTAVSQSCARRVQDRLALTVGGLVSECLAGVVPGFRLSFVPVFETKRGQTECSFALADAKGNRQDPLRCNGGGVCDIIAFALRVCVLLLEQKPSRNVLVLDEPFKFLHGSVQQERAFETLMKIADRLKMQIIVVNQDPLDDPRAVSYAVSQTGGRSHVSKGA